MGAPTISWPFGTDYKLEAAPGGGGVIVTTVPWWPWSKPKRWRLDYVSCGWYWAHNGQELRLASQGVWNALRRAQQAAPRDMTFTDYERASLVRLLKLLNPKEDLVGVLVYHGVLRDLGDGGAARLARKLEDDLD